MRVIMKTLNKATSKTQNISPKVNALKARKKTIVGLVMVIAIVILTFLYLGNYFTPNTLKITTYNNGSNRYSLIFYARHAMVNRDESSQVKSLLASKGVHGYAPLKLTISEQPLTKEADQTALVADRCASRKPISVVRNVYANKNVKICDYYDGPSGHQRYAASFKAQNRLYTVLINQEDSVRNTRKGLKAYQKDITAIIASIQPVK